MQKWQITVISSWRIEKSKHVHVEIGGDSPTNLHLHAGSKDVAEAITAKLQSSKGLSSPPASNAPLRTSAETEDEEGSDGHDSEPQRERETKAAPSVRFATTPPSIISPREASEDGEADYRFASTSQGRHSGSGEPAIALYDFAADGEDELSVHENEELVVIEKDADDWWKCRNTRGQEGVVPASYLEVSVQSLSMGVVSNVSIFLAYCRCTLVERWCISGR